MSNQEIEDNSVNTGTTDRDGEPPGKPRVSDLATVGHHPATDQTRNKIKWEKKVNKVAIKFWIRKK